MRFTKMHGIGNDYIYIDGFQQTVDEPQSLARVMSDRHTGVGGDGLILILPPAPGIDAHARMRMFNADGSEAQMCGNGIRCVAKYVHDHGIAGDNPLRIQTGNGVLSLDLTTNGRGKVEQVTVDMGRPRYSPEQVPIDAAALDPTDAPHTFDIPLENVRAAFTGTFVNMGNPHVCIFVNVAQAVQLDRVGPTLEHHKAFPERMNIHFVQVDSTQEVTMRTWERGSGATRACGTGASAVCVAGALTDRTGRSILAHLPGGDLRIEWRDDDHVYMTGPAEEVFNGEWLGG